MVCFVGGIWHVAIGLAINTVRVDIMIIVTMVWNIMISSKM